MSRCSVCGKHGASPRKKRAVVPGSHVVGNVYQHPEGDQATKDDMLRVLGLVTMSYTEMPAAKLPKGSPPGHRWAQYPYQKAECHYEQKWRRHALHQYLPHPRLKAPKQADSDWHRHEVVLPAGSAYACYSAPSQSVSSGIRDLRSVDPILFSVCVGAHMG